MPRATSSNRDSKSPAIPLLLFAFLTTVLCKTSFAATITNDDPEYAPGKVRWADKKTQNNNKSDTLTFHDPATGDHYRQLTSPGD